MKKMLKILAAGLSAALTAVSMAAPPVAALHGDVISYENITIGNLKDHGFIMDSFPGRAYFYTDGNVTIEKEVCAEVLDWQQLTVLSGTKLTVNGALDVNGQLYIEEGGWLCVNGEICIHGAAVSAGQITGGSITVYDGGTLYCTPSSVIRSKGKYLSINVSKNADFVIKGTVRSENPGTYSTKAYAAITSDGACTFEGDDFHYPDNGDFRTGRYIPADSKYSRVTALFDNGSSIKFFSCDTGIYEIAGVEVRQPRTACEEKEIITDDGDYVLASDVSRYTVDKNGKIKVRENPGGAAMKYVKKLGKLKLIKHAGVWNGNPLAKLYDTGDGKILWIQPQSVKKYTAKVVYEAFLYEKKR